MQAILRSQQNYLASNEPSFASAANDPMMGEQTVSRLQVFIQKIKEIGSAVKIATGQLTGSRNASGQMLPFAERGDFTSGLLGGLGLESLQKLYIDKQSIGDAVDGGEESSLEKATKEEKVIENSSDSAKYLMELNTSAQTYYPFIEMQAKDIRELKEFIMANWGSLSRGGGGIDLPGGGGGRGRGGRKLPKGGGARGGGAPKGAGGAKVPSKIPGALGATGNVLSRLAAPLAIAGGGYEIYQNEKAVDAGDLTREEATKQNTQVVAGTGAGLVGAAGGAKFGAILGAMTGPAAPIAIPILSILGGITGFFAGDKLGRAVVESAQNAPVGDTDMTDPEAAAFMTPTPMSNVPEVSEAVGVARQQLDATLKSVQANPIDQKVTNNVQNNTTVINPRNNVAPSNPDATFRGFTGESSFPLAP